MRVALKRIALPLFLVLAASLPLRADGPYPVAMERGVAATMRDGVILYADVYRPDAAGRFPVLLQRTPYNKDGEAAFGIRAAARGYVVVVQDVRGRYTSHGEWYPFRNESNDGYDTVEWAAALPYSNGKVGMFGGSYVGATQMLAAIATPPHLAGICPFVTASNYHRNWTYQGGAFEQWFNQSWTTGLAQNTVERALTAASDALTGDRTVPLAQYPLFNVPSASTPAEMTQEFAPYYLDWLAHPAFDDYWRRWSIEDHYAKIQVPALTISAWYDIFQGGSLRNYQGLRDGAGNEEARRNQRLLVAIGGHAGGGRNIGAVDFGPAAAEFDADRTILDWYDYLFKGAQNQFASGKPVRIFVMGRNLWRDESEWPLARAKETRFFLESNGRANSLNGDGALSTQAPGGLGKPAGASPYDRYVYDPANPAPTIGGPLCCDAVHLPAGPRDQRPAEQRPDVLVYSTAPFTVDTEVTGPVRLELYASSSAVDTDFTAKLVDVGPDGFARNLTEGILRARYRDSQETAKQLVPGKVYKLDIDLWSTSNVFLAGHRLRLEVSSSNFPRFDRNPNTWDDPESAQNFEKATNTVFHDAARPSALVLPLVP